MKSLLTFILVLILFVAGVSMGQDNSLINYWGQTIEIKQSPQDTIYLWKDGATCQTLLNFYGTMDSIIGKTYNIMGKEYIFSDDRNNYNADYILKPKRMP